MVMGNNSKPLMEMTNEELWQLFPVILSGHHPEWEELYREERNMLRQIFGRENIRRISHIGSTAVDGLIAKPTIDVLVEIMDETDVGDLIRKMEDAGYIYLPQPGNPPPHIMFIKGYTPHGFEGQVYHVHVRYAGDWDELYFRDYLRDHPATAIEYGQLKQNLLEEYKNNRDGYTDAKGDFIRQITSLARSLYPGRYLYF